MEDNKKYPTMFAFVAEQNRYMRTGGLPANHPNGKLEPGDVPLSPAEKRFWEREERQYQKMINELNGIYLDDED